VRIARQYLLVLVVALIAVSAGSASARPDLGPEADFRLPDGSAACRYDSGVLFCQTRSPGSAVRLARTGTVVVKDAPVEWDARTPVLRRSWKRGGISCIAGATLRCENRSGTQLVVGGKLVAVLAPPAVSP
jgi:hypothetical protein